ncbi:MAG: HAMP domain-containing sensor histidine kinase [Bacteroidota bacterium]
MFKRNTILLQGIFAILVLFAGQAIIIRGLWKQQDEMLYLRYRSLSQEAGVAIRGSRIQLFDTVSLLLNNYSEAMIRKLQTISDPQSGDEYKAEILAYFKKVLDMEQDQSLYLSSFFEEQGFEKDFNHRIVITNLELYGNDTIMVYRDPAFRDRKDFRGIQGAPVQPSESRSTILVNRPWLENNNFNLYFDYYIDFSDMQMMILHEIAWSLAMSIFSIVIVVAFFLYTYRNLMEEKRLSNLKTDFINNMTHELKTPLATITVAGKTLELDKIRADDSRVLETARLIGKQSVHLNQLINMILEISMWERTQFELDKKKVDIGEVMNDIVFSFKSGYGNRATFCEKYNFNEIKADIDVVYFTTLINNLLSNAVKYCDKEPEINIEGMAENNNIRIKIADNGIGITKTDQKHVFDKFYRASSGNIHKYKGLGLGLYYVKKIAVAHGGDVTVSSKPGKGSIFTVTLPY